MLNEGMDAPDFELPDHHGKIHKLSDYLGKKVVLYFYPEDDTPGCTKEACNFRDSYKDIEGKGAIVLGISPDNEISHTKFIEKFNLPFTLLADIEKKVSKLYESYGTKTAYGKTYDGMFRNTFIIDEKGKISKIFLKVNPEKHKDEVLEALSQ